MEASSILAFNQIVINGRFLSQSISGVQRCAIELASRLVTLNPSIIIIAPVTINQTCLAQSLKPVIIGSTSGHRWEQTELPAYLKKIGYPLLINLGNSAPVGYKNQMVILHDVAFLAYPSHFSLPFKLFYHIIWYLLSRQVKKIITVSNFSKGEIENYLPASRGKISVIYNGFNPLPSSNKKNNERYFLMVGNLDGRKNLTIAISAFLEASLPVDVTLKIVGSASRVFRYKQQSYPPSIEFLGRKNDEELGSLYSGATALIYPSLYEGFGLPPLEAMSCQCPVIAADISIFHEILEDAVYYINPLSMDSIKQAIILMYHNQLLCEELSTKGIQQIKKYSWDKAAIKLNQLITTLSGDGRSKE